MEEEIRTDVQKIIATTIRFPENVYEAVRSLAEEERRSINNQVIIMLESYLYALAEHSDWDSDD